MPRSRRRRRRRADRPGQGHCCVVDRLVDRLLAQPAQRLASEQHPQFVRDLLRAPTFRQQQLDGLGQHRVDGDPPLTRLARPAPGGVLGVVWSVAAVRIAVATDLAADR